MFFWDWTMIILIPGLIISAIAQAKVTSSFNRYSRIQSRSGLTGFETANRLLAVQNVPVTLHSIAGSLTDHFDPRNKTIGLSQPVGNSASLAAVAVAAHETGHAYQDYEGYFGLKFRNAIVPVCNFATNAAWPLFFIGLIFGGASQYGVMLMNIGILFFSFSLIFNLVTLPVEFNASHRALVMLQENQMLGPDEIKGARRVLSAAAMTYVAATLVSFLNLLRMILLRDSRS
ncbi:MAG: zinc metallopeptidase [Pseudoramibacter sp.]|jgi:Zn-dependent membrane protease YugP